MNQPNKVLGLLGEAFLSAIREAVREEIQNLNCQGEKERDRLLTAEEAARILSVSSDWLYRNARKLPFSRKLGPKMLRFSKLGMEMWTATRMMPCRD